MRKRSGRNVRGGLERTIATSEDSAVLFPHSTQVDPACWLEVSADRRGWLATFVGEQLGQLDLRTRIRWQSETKLTQPQVLPLLLALVRRYELRLADDEPLAVALLAETRATRAYHQRFGLSDRAVAAIEELLEAAGTPNPGLDQILSFVRDVGLRTPGIMAAIERIAMDAARPTRIRDGAVRIIAAAKDAEALLRVALTLPPDLRREADDLLVDVQHRGTIERRLRQLLNDPPRSQAVKPTSRFQQSAGVGRKNPRAGRLGHARQTQAPRTPARARQSRKPTRKYAGTDRHDARGPSD